MIGWFGTGITPTRRIEPLRPSRPRSRAPTVRGNVRVRATTKAASRFVFMAGPPNLVHSPLPTFDSEKVARASRVETRRLRAIRRRGLLGNAGGQVHVRGGSTMTKRAHRSVVTADH